MKRYGAFLACILGLSVMAATAQQITRLAVVDVQKVMLSFYRESKAMREYEDRKAKVQAEIEKMQLEIKDLQRQKSDAETKDDKTASADLDRAISVKTDYLKQFYAARSAELEDMKKKMFESNQFVQEVYNEIQAVAEREGFSIALDLKASNGIIWYSPAIDITDKVVQNLSGKIPQ